MSLQVYSVSSTLREPAWLLQLREQAWHQFHAMPEPWLEKTDLQKRGWDTGAFTTAPTDVPTEVKTYLDGLTHSYCVFVDGHLVTSHVSKEATDKGVVITSIHEAAKTQESVLKKHLGTVVPLTESKWAALNMALFAGGVFLHVPRGVNLAEPVEAIHVITSAAGGSFLRSMVIAEELADVSYIETSFIATDRPKVTSSHVIEVIAQPGSRVHVATAEELHKGSTYFLTRRACVQKDALVEWTVSDVSDGFTVELVENVLQGHGARGFTRVVGIGHGREHMDLTASMVHVGRNTESDIVMRSALRERANSVYRSRTQIVKGAVGAGSEQHDRMIMIDGSARADAIPMLLIDENDVNRCGHAASVGKIDPNQIYYLMSRGIPRRQATLMIIWGYLRDVVSALPSESLRELVVARMERELGR